MIMKDAKERFGDRVENYRKYRPGYPAELASFIKNKCRPEKDWVIADIGSGTGISSRFVNEHIGCTVFAIEPNDEMRKEAQKSAAAFESIVSIDGSSEETTLPDESVQMVTAFQSFHWFDKEKTKAEMRRILKNPKWMLWVWNYREIEGNEFLEGYEIIASESPHYKRVNHRNLRIEDMRAFADNDEIECGKFLNTQSLDCEGMLGRFFSSSYTSAEGTTEHEKQKNKLMKLFAKTNTNGLVEFKYTTQAFLSRFK